MPGKSGIEATRAVLAGGAVDDRCSCSRCRTTRGTSARRSRPGASGYVMKEAADDEVVDAVRAVASGQRYLHPALGARLVEAESEERRRAAAGPALRPRAGDPPPPRARPHEPGDREDALRLGSHRRDAPGPHHAEARAHEPGRARPVRPRRGHAGRAASRPPRPLRDEEHVALRPVDGRRGGRARPGDDEQVDVEVACDLQERFRAIPLRREAPGRDVPEEQRLARLVDEAPQLGRRRSRASRGAATTATVEPYPARSATASSARCEALEPS